jgi:hypothetical protein
VSFFAKHRYSPLTEAKISSQYLVTFSTQSTYSGIESENGGGRLDKFGITCPKIS